MVGERGALIDCVTWFWVGFVDLLDYVVLCGVVVIYYLAGGEFWCGLVLGFGATVWVCVVMANLVGWLSSCGRW